MVEHMIISFKMKDVVAFWSIFTLPNKFWLVLPEGYRVTKG